MRTFVFDLDNTLYPKEVGLWKVIDDRIEEFVRRTLGTDPVTARSVRKGFLRVFGTTLKGLMVNHDVNPRDYLSYVHDVPVEEMLSPDRELREMLLALPGRRFVFTNASGDYAERVLRALGVEDCFEEVLDIFFMDHMAKPGLYPFRKLLVYLGEDPGSVVFFDDHPANAKTAMNMGIFTVLIGEGKNGECADLILPSVKQLPRYLNFILSARGECDKNR
ncbi:MAG: pyrimidine 5'-nucleotidase [Deltaproteobacteria bacterium]|nr:MAG: pyrimidine 5'-nucleotidase [Deltaproteobacteria bacterium]